MGLTPGQHTGRFRELDAYRALAAVLIVVYHAYYQHDRPYLGTPLDAILDRLWLSVGWFFTLSGFVIFLPFARRALNGQPAPAIGPFFRRRILRVVPLYSGVLLLMWPFVSDGTDWARRDLLLHLTFTQIYDPDHFYGQLAPAWSLAVEMHFYLLIAALGPLLCRVCTSLTTQRGRTSFLYSALGALLIASIGHKLWLPPLPEPWLIHAAPIDFLDTFALGMALAVASASKVTVPTRSEWPLRGLGVILCGLYTLLPVIGVEEQRYMQLPAGLGFTLILASTVLARHDTAWARVLRWPLPAGAGALSYGIYLWHIPLLMVFAATGVAFTATTGFVADLALLFLGTLPLAALGYRYIERPALRWRDRRTPVAAETQPPHLNDEPPPAFAQP